MSGVSEQIIAAAEARRSDSIAFLQGLIALQREGARIRADDADLDRVGMGGARRARRQQGGRGGPSGVGCRGDSGGRDGDDRRFGTDFPDTILGGGGNQR